MFAFAAGLMLSAAFAELILPAVDGAELCTLFECLAGLMGGGALLHLLQMGLDRFGAARLRRNNRGSAQDAERLNRALLFLAAIAVHNLPEGLAAGVGQGGGDLRRAVAITAGIALQNVPEGMIVIPPLVNAGVSRKKALGAAVVTGVIEIFGVFLGGFAAAGPGAVLPLLLCFAGGTMLYIICTDVIDDANRMAGKALAGYAFLLGCCAMLLTEKLL